MPRSAGWSPAVIVPATGVLALLPVAVLGSWRLGLWIAFGVPLVHVGQRVIRRELTLASGLWTLAAALAAVLALALAAAVI